MMDRGIAEPEKETPKGVQRAINRRRSIDRRLLRSRCHRLIGPIKVVALRSLRLQDLEAWAVLAGLRFEAARLKAGEWASIFRIASGS